jgi:DNA-3-methyladenine glycosylase II
MRSAVGHLKKADPILAAIIDKVGPCRMQFGQPQFHSLAEAIVYQQLNGKAAVTLSRHRASSN